MSKVSLTRDHHLLTRNLKLNDNYISNDGGDEGISISDAGLVTVSGDLDIASNMTIDDNEIDISSGDFLLDVAGDITLDAGGGDIILTEAGSTNTKLVFDPAESRLRIHSSMLDYFQIDVNSSAATEISTVHWAGSTGHLSLKPDGNCIIDVGITATNYTQIDRNITSASAATNGPALWLDYDRTGSVTSGTDENTGLDLDMNVTGAGTSGTPTVTSVGIDMDIVGDNAGSGSSTVTGMDINVSGADTNYALITTGGNVGIGVADPDQALEVNGDIHVENTVYFSAETVNTIGDGATEEIDWNVSQKQKVTITGTGITCNFDDPAGACNLLLKVVQGDGSDVIATWDEDIKWAGGAAPTLSTGNGEIDILSFYFDGTNYFGVASLDFATP